MTHSFLQELCYRYSLLVQCCNYTLLQKKDNSNTEEPRQSACCELAAWKFFQAHLYAMQISVHRSHFMVTQGHHTHLGALSCFGPSDQNCTQSSQKLVAV